MKNKTQNQKIHGVSDKLTLKEIDDKLMELLSEGIKPPTQKELKRVDSLKTFFEKQKEEGKYLRWQCPLCGKFIREITGSGQIKDLLINFQKDTLHIKCKNKHRNWFYLKGDNLIFKAVTESRDAQRQSEKSFALTRESLDMQARRK
jgi:hypothetical protein